MLYNGVYFLKLISGLRSTVQQNHGDRRGIIIFPGARSPHDASGVRKSSGYLLRIQIRNKFKCSHMRRGKEKRKRQAPNTGAAADAASVASSTN